MRISVVLGGFFPVPAVQGGAVEKIWHALAIAFAARGHQVTLVTRRYPGMRNDETVGGVRYLRLPSRDRPASAVIYRLFDLLFALRVAAALPPSDVTICNSITLPLLIPRRRAGRIYVSVARFPKGQMGLYRRADRLQAVSTPVADAIRAQSPAVAGIVRMVPNTLTSIFATTADAPSGPPRARRILYVGRIAREKGIDLLIRAFATISRNHPEWSLQVIGPWQTSQGGDGEALLDELRALAAASAAPVEFVDPIFDEAALAARYEAAAIFVYPSLAEQGESFGLAPLEAMACGCAPIVSDLACFRDFIVDRENGLVFDHRDRTGAPLAAALATLIASPDRRAGIAAQARETSRRYTPARVADLFLADFAELTGAASIAP